MNSRIAIAEALTVTVILGSTLVLSKIALQQLGPLTITGVRYLLASLLLLPFILSRKSYRLARELWLRLALLGVAFYVIGNGALYIGLQYVPATTASLLLSLVPLLVAGGELVLLGEKPSQLQASGLILALIGSGLFFAPGLEAGEFLGIAIILVGLLGNAAFDILGREVQSRRLVDTLTLTGIPMAIGSALILPAALVLEGPPRASLPVWGIVILLAVVHTAIVYMLMNHALLVLAAFQLAAIVNLTPIFTALWAALILGDRLMAIQVAGIAAAVLGVILVETGRPQVP